MAEPEPPMAGAAAESDRRPAWSRLLLHVGSGPWLPRGRMSPTIPCGRIVIVDMNPDFRLDARQWDGFSGDQTGPLDATNLGPLYLPQ